MITIKPTENKMNLSYCDYKFGRGLSEWWHSWPACQILRVLNAADNSMVRVLGVDGACKYLHRISYTV